jgi:hypothetical protein
MDVMWRHIPAAIRENLMEHPSFYFVYIDFHLGFICTNIYKLLLECISSLYFSGELPIRLPITRPAINISMMQTREQLRI